MLRPSANAALAVIARSARISENFFIITIPPLSEFFPLQRRILYTKFSDCKYIFVLYHNTKLLFTSALRIITGLFAFIIVSVGARVFDATAEI